MKTCAVGDIHGAYKALIQCFKRAKFDYKQDRLSRRLKDLLGLLEEIDSLGIGYKSATEPFDTTSSAGKMAIQMLGSCAEFERNRLVERVFPGMVVGVKRGHWQGARYAPYGYRYNKEAKKLEVHPEEAKIVKEILMRPERFSNVTAPMVWLDSGIMFISFPVF